MKIVRAINVYTNETHEGTFEEVSHAIYADQNVVRKAAATGGKVDKQWIVAVIGDAEDFPHHLRRLGLEKECVVCGKTFAAKRPTILCCSKNCTKKRDIMSTQELHRKQRIAAKTAKENKNKTLAESANEADKKCMKKKKAVIKKQSVCKGCKYYIKNCTLAVFRNTCDYLSQTGHSRIVVEMENGGVKADSCICYEAGRYRDRCKQPMHIKK